MPAIAPQEDQADLTAGARLREAVERERPLQVVGVIHAYAALLAERAGFRALYLSGAGVANASLGLPDLGLTTLDDVLTDAGRITGATTLPLLVDADTGWPSDEGMTRTVRGLIDAGVAGMHIEDQVEAKRCGHRPGKQLVSTAEMVDRVAQAAQARGSDALVIMARTDAAANEGLDSAIERAQAYVEAGADMIFAEALTEPGHYREFCRAVDAPVLANMTEFGRSPLLTVDELRDLGVRLALYPLSAFRAMNHAAEHVYRTIRDHGTQRDLIDRMQTREQLYDTLDYYNHERAIDRDSQTETRHG